jgi:DNA-nicking Smr family endonuclease
MTRPRDDRAGRGASPRAPGTANGSAAPRAADADLFRDAVRDVRPLPAPPPLPEAPRPAPRAHMRRADDEAVLAESLELGPGELLVETGDELLFRRATLSGRTLRRLQRGEFRVEDEIDLHGLIAVEAREALRVFLNEAIRRGLRCVRVIHGKGLRSGPRGPVLKHAVNTWLRKTGAVLAFASARQVDGGTGAVYVLLFR